MHSDDPPGPASCHHEDMMKRAIHAIKELTYPHPRPPPANEAH
jgi:hypothetical protein